MSKRKRVDEDEQPIPVPEILMAVGACWLAFRGADPGDVAKRAGAAAVKVRALLERLEGMSEDVVRRVVDCKSPAACGCLYCEDKRKEAERPS